MLQLTRQADYGLRLVLDVAAQGDRPVSSAEVARHQRMPYEFLRKVARVLVSRGLLTSERGPGGGLKLARPPREITLLEVIGSFAPTSLNRCTADPPRCDRRDSCAVFAVWVEAQREVERVLAGTSVAAMTARQARLDGARSGAAGHSRAAAPGGGITRTATRRPGSGRAKAHGGRVSQKRYRRPPVRTWKKTSGSGPVETLERTSDR